MKLRGKQSQVKRRQVHKRTVETSYLLRRHAPNNILGSRGPPGNLDMSTVNDSTLRETPSLAPYTKVALGDLVHSEDLHSWPPL